MNDRREEATQALRHALLERLMHYYHFLGERLMGNHSTVSSSQIANLLDMDDTLVRKDLAAIGVRGLPRKGFNVEEILTAIREVLGFDTTYKAAIVGAGRLGGALASYPGFARFGLSIVTIFDVDPQKEGMVIGGSLVQHLDNLEAVVQRHRIRMAILTVPADTAQSVADRLVAAGIQAIWNFAPTSLVVPDHVVVRHEHISVGLAELAYHLKRHQESKQS